jgi:hypothetical protein
MTLRLTPQMLAAAYDFLRTSQPFSGWKLPESDAVAFTVNHHKYWFGSHQGAETCLITISDATVGHTSTLIRVMAHEMIHLRQYLHGEESRKISHNRDFRRKAALICKIHGFDEKAF